MPPGVPVTIDSLFDIPCGRADQPAVANLAATTAPSEVHCPQALWTTTARLGTGIDEVVHSLGIELGTSFRSRQRRVGTTCPFTCPHGCGRRKSATVSTGGHARVTVRPTVHSTRQPVTQVTGDVGQLLWPRESDDHEQLERLPRRPRRSGGSASPAPPRSPAGTAPIVTWAASGSCAGAARRRHRPSRGRSP